MQEQEKLNKEHDLLELLKKNIEQGTLQKENLRNFLDTIGTSETIKSITKGEELEVIQVKQYLGEAIKYIIRENEGKKKILIIAPMRGGKTTAIRELKKNFKRELGEKVKVVVISPKRTLQEMLVSDLGFTRVCGEYPYNNYTVSPKDVVTTPDSSYKVFNELNDKNINYVVVFDEIHTMYLHASFRPKLLIPKIYSNSKNMIKFIGLTATGEFIPPVEFDKRILVKPLAQWKFTKKVEVVDYTSKDNLIENALLELQEGIKTYKQIVFRHNDKKVLEEIKKGLEALNIDSLIFSSDEFKNNEELNKYIAERQTIGYKVVLTTSSTDEGVELLTNDSNVLVLATYNEYSNIIDIIQHFGRYRNDTAKCKILCFKLAKGCKFEERKKELEQYTRLCLKFSFENSKAFEPKFIRSKKENFEIKEEVILEECIKADLNYKVNTIDKMIDYLKQHYLFKGIEVIRAKGKENLLENTFKDIKVKLKEQAIEENNQREKEEMMLNRYMVDCLKYLESGKQTLFFKNPHESIKKENKNSVMLNKENELECEENKLLEELEPFYSMFWNDNNKEKRKHYRELLAEDDINDLIYIDTIVDLLYTKESYNDYLKFKELEKVRELKPKQISELANDIQKISKRELNKKEKMGVLIRYALQDKEIKQGRITQNDLENIKILLEENKLLTQKQLQRKKELGKILNSLIENIYSFKGNQNLISRIRKSIFTF